MNKNESKDMVKVENATSFEIVELDDMDLDAAAGGLAAALNISQCSCSVNAVAGCGATP